MLWLAVQARGWLQLVWTKFSVLSLIQGRRANSHPPLVPWHEISIFFGFEYRIKIKTYIAIKGTLFTEQSQDGLFSARAF